MKLLPLSNFISVKHGGRVISLSSGDLEMMSRIWRDYSGRLNMSEVCRAHDGIQGQMTGPLRQIPLMFWDDMRGTRFAPGGD